MNTKRSSLFCALAATSIFLQTVEGASLNLEGDYLFTNWKAGIDNATFVGTSDTRYDFGFTAGGHLEGYASTDPLRPGEFLMVFGGAPTVGRVTFNHYDGTNWHDRVVIARDGSITMEGTLTASAIIVQQNVWADYVFAGDYRLMPLADVNSFIKQNGHLPGVPSAKEVAENGVNIADMTKVLLEKVEELTLHVIALKEENELLKMKVSSIATSKN
jgi:hypothetical protein